MTSISRLMELAAKFEKRAQPAWLEQYMKEQEGQKQGPAFTPEQGVEEMLRERMQGQQGPQYARITSNDPRVIIRLVHGALGPDSAVTRYFHALRTGQATNFLPLLGPAVDEIRQPQTRAAMVRSYGEKDGGEKYEWLKRMLETSASQHRVYIPTAGPATPEQAAPEAPAEFAAGYQTESKRHDAMMKLAARLQK